MSAADALWSLVLGRPRIDADELARSLDRALAETQPDSRTRLLIRDAADGLRRRWG